MTRRRSLSVGVSSPVSAVHSTGSRRHCLTCWTRASLPLVAVTAADTSVSTAGWVAYLAAVVLYALIAVVAVVPSLVTAGLSVKALQAEAVLLTVLVFIGVNVAWLLLFDDTPATGGPAHRA